MMNIMELFLYLLMGHAVADFALQSSDMAQGKNRNRKTTPPPGAKYQPTWHYWLSAHSLIHGAAVTIITGVWWLGLAETICHWLIDFGKCDNLYGIHTDQWLHIGCKVLWVFIMIGIFK